MAFASRLESTRKVLGFSKGLTVCSTGLVRSPFVIDSIVSGLDQFVIPLASLAADAASVPDDRWWRFLGRLHPLVVHFPIGLALAAAGVEFVNIVARRREASPFALTATGLAAVAAAFAAWFGWLNADFEGATQDNTLFLHRWLGILGAAALVVVWVCGRLGRSGARPGALNGYRWGLLVTAVVVGVGAHFGGEMVYGRGYLTKVLFPASPRPAAPTSGAEDAASTDADGGEPTEGASTPDSNDVGDAVSLVSFQKDVLPILDARCVECHGPDKVKGSLRMDSFSALFEGDPEWWTVVPGKPEQSLLLERVELPADDADAMPPKGDRLSAAEIGTIRTWIEQGATDDGAAAAGPVGPALPGDSVAPEGPAAAATASSTAVEAAVTALREREVLVMPIAQGSDDWEVNASLVDPPFGDDDLVRLDGLQPVLVWANLARSALTDAGLAPLGEYRSLTRVRLDNTAIGDAGVPVLLQLPRLETVNLYGSRLSDAGLAALAAHPSLRRVYCSESQVTAAGVAAAARDGLEIVGPEPVEATTPSPTPAPTEPTGTVEDA